MYYRLSTRQEMQRGSKWTFNNLQLLHLSGIWNGQEADWFSCLEYLWKLKKYIETIWLGAVRKCWDNRNWEVAKFLEKEEFRRGGGGIVILSVCLSWLKGMVVGNWESKFISPEAYWGTEKLAELFGGDLTGPRWVLKSISHLAYLPNTGAAWSRGQGTPKESL